MSSEADVKPPNAFAQAISGIKCVWNCVWLGLKAFILMLWYPLVPFMPKEIELKGFPTTGAEIEEVQVTQSQWLFEQSESRRLRLEDKARSTFTLIAFLAPLLGSTFVILSREIPSSSLSHLLTVAFFFASACMLVLAFISAVRAVSVRAMTSPYLGAVVNDEDRQFLKYDRAFHARGFLHCVLVNAPLNDHIAQLVKGAHVLTAVAVLSFLVAAASIGASFANRPSLPNYANVTGSIDVSSTDLALLRHSFENLSRDIGALASNSGSGQLIDQLKARINRVEELLAKQEKQGCWEPKLKPATP